MTRKPRLLFLSQTLPFPPDSGVNIRTFYTLRALADEFAVTVVAFFRRRAFRGSEDIPSAVHQLEVRTGTQVAAHPIPMEWSRPRAALVHAGSLFAARPFTHFAHASTPFGASVIDGLAAPEPLIVHFDSLDLSRWVQVVRRHAPRAAITCTHHNVESALLRRRALAERQPLVRWYIRHQARLYEREEESVCPLLDLNVAVSDHDAQLLREKTSAAVAVVPNGVDVDFFSPTENPSRRGAIFVGGTTWFPNRDALDFFAASILPRIREQMPDFPVTWVGRCTDEEQTQFRRKHDIQLTGYVDDVRPHLARATCLVVPLRVGGGTRLKIPTAWAAGVPIVTTAVGREGLEGKHGEHFLVHDDPNAFADAVIQLSADATLRSRLSKQGREMAVTNYSWKALGENLVGLYRGLLHNR